MSFELHLFPSRNSHSTVYCRLSSFFKFKEAINFGTMHNLKHESKADLLLVLSVSVAGNE